MYRFLFTASSLSPFYCETMQEAREYMQEYALRGHKDCKVWSLTDFMNCQDSFKEFPQGEERIPDFVKAIQENPPVVFRDIDAQIRNYAESGVAEGFITATSREERAPADSAQLLKDEGRKYDSGKLRFSLIPHDILLEVLHVLEFGALKYGSHNWRLVVDAKARYWDAAMRHLWDAAGEQLDSETQRRHEAHAICCLLFRGQLLIEEYQEKSA